MKTEILPERVRILQNVRSAVGKSGICLDMAIAQAAGIERFVEIRGLVSTAGHFGETSVARWYNAHSLDEVLAVVDRAAMLELGVPVKMESGE